MAKMPFWRRKKLTEMSPQEWESLCDGCAKCCLLKLEDIDTGEIHYTDVACRLLDTRTCRCTDYPHRKKKVSGCVKLSPSNIVALKWMPQTCAYRLLAEGKDLPDWHPLVSGSTKSVHHSGISIRGKVISEHNVDDDEIEARLVDWVN